MFAASDWAETSVETVRLSERLPEGPVDFLKLDVEGAELVVLSELEASGALARIEQVALEVHPLGPAHLPAVLDVLVRAGFRHRVAVVNDRFWDDSQLLLVDAFRD